MALHVKRRSTPACRLHARTMAPATWTVCTSPAVAAQASQGQHVPSSLTSVPSARVLTARAAAWAPATSASVIQVGSPRRQQTFSQTAYEFISASERRSPTECDIHGSGFLSSGAHVLLVELLTGLCFYPCDPFTSIVRKLESARRQNGEIENQLSLVTQRSCQGKQNVVPFHRCLLTFLLVCSMSHTPGFLWEHSIASSFISQKYFAFMTVLFKLWKFGNLEGRVMTRPHRCLSHLLVCLLRACG